MRASASDQAFCRALLPEVSRTFALSIEALPQELREAVRTAYLLCRIADTVEDATGLRASQRERLFDDFDGLAAGSLERAARFARAAAENALDAGSAEGRLCRGAEAVVRVFGSLPVDQQDAIRPAVATMAGGMRDYCRRAERGSQLHLTDVADLERYCYFVAGTVGELLTGLFEQAVGVLPGDVSAALRARAVSFGVGLQLVNILRDIAEDHARGVSFVPEQLAEAEGVPVVALLRPEHRGAGMRIVRRLASLARDHLRAAVEYTLLWPASGAASLAVRRFCAVPLALALATLARIEAGEDALVAGRAPKVSRATVGRVLEQVAVRGDSDAALRALFDELAGSP